MKKITLICSGLLLATSSAVFAVENHGKVALERATAAAKASDAKEIVKQASAALEHSLASAIVMKGASQKHMQTASNHLEEAINAGNLGHADQAKTHVNAAITEIQGANS
ncbi:MAG: small metal-binding protein SmbP [Methylobacter sp.]